MPNKSDWYNTIRGQFGKDEPKSPEALAEDREGFMNFLGSLIATAPAGDLARMLGWDIPRRKESIEETVMNAAFGSMGTAKITNFPNMKYANWHKKLMADMDIRVQQMQEKVSAYPGWKFEIGDKVYSAQTKRIYKISGKLWNKKRDTPIYRYVSGEESGDFVAELAHKSLKLVKPLGRIK